MQNNTWPICILFCFFLEAAFCFFTSNISNPITDGATALKLENEVQSDAIDEINNSIDQNSEIVSDPLSSTEATNNEVHNDEVAVSNGLENFKIDEEETLELFNSENNENKSEDFSESINKDEIDNEDLEIPAFLRRQKN